MIGLLHATVGLTEFVRLSVSTSMTSSDVRNLRETGLILLEPLPGQDFTAFRIHGSASEHTVSTPPVREFPDALRQSSRVDWGRENEPAIGIWYYAPGSTADVLTALERIGFVPYSTSRIPINAWAGYEIAVGPAVRASIDAILEIPEVRWVYPVRGEPETEDELAALEVARHAPSDGARPRYREVYGAICSSTRQPLIGCIDTGFDNEYLIRTHSDVRDRLIGVLKYRGAPAFDSSGHGTHVGGILIGDGGSGRADSDGYLLGMGMIPDGFLLMSNAIRAAPFPPEGGMARMAYDLSRNGVLVCNNAWNDREGIGIGYTANCAIWDQAVRNSAGAFNPVERLPLLPVFSCGNNGPDASTITSPKEAKNIVTVGAVGSLRSPAPGVVWDLSSRGPCLDGRIAPLTAAPGVDIYSCAPNEWHALQTGTSMAAAHASGVAAVIARHILDTCAASPSPAAIRGLLVALAEPISDQIPDMASGFGVVSIHDLPGFNPELSLMDQRRILTRTGDHYDFRVAVIDTDKPLRIALCWTDPPAAPDASPALINDLSLDISSGASRFTGNAFSGRFSMPGGTRDHLNTIELIAIEHPEPVVDGRILAETIRGDGIPDNDFPADQDFTIVAINGILVESDPRAVIADDGVNCYDASQAVFLSRDPQSDIRAWIEIPARGLRVAIPMTERIPGSGVYTGRFCTDADAMRPGSIAAADGDRIELTVETADGTVRSRPVTVSCGAPDALQPDVIDIRDRSATIVFRTALDARSTMHYRESPDGIWRNRSDSVFLRNHTIALEDLDACTRYEAWIELTGRNGSRTRLGSSYHPLRWMTDRQETVYEADMEEDPHWPVMEGLWRYGQPEGTGSPPDPVSGFTGMRVIGYNLEGDYENALSPQHAQSPPVDCSLHAEYSLEMAYWLCSESNILDKAVIAVTDRGGIYRQVWANPLTTLYGGNWDPILLDITDLVAGSGSASIRITQGQTDPIRAMCGWNIDDLSIRRTVPCVDPTPVPFDDAEPGVRLISNDLRFGPGDRMRIEAWIENLEVDRSVGFAAAILLGDAVYFYPSWTPDEPDWIEVRGTPADPGSWDGTDRRILLDMVWPESYRCDLEFDCAAVLVDMENNDVIDADEIISLEYEYAASGLISP